MLCDVALEPGVDHLARRILAPDKERRPQGITSAYQSVPCHPERTGVEHTAGRSDDDLLYVESLARGGEAVKEQSNLQRRGAMLGRDGQLHEDWERGPARRLGDPDICAGGMPRTAPPPYPAP